MSSSDTRSAQLSGKRDPAAGSAKSPFPAWAPVVFLCVVWAALFLVRLSAPSDLLDNDQERPAAYMLDAAVNGHWICQVDDMGDICSKPPVYTWAGALLTVAFGRINHFALFFPSALGVLGCCLLIYRFGKPLFGRQGAFLGAFMYLASVSGAKMIFLARTDSLFSFFVALTAFLAYRAWKDGKGWVWFGLAAGVASLTKGPLGAVLAAGGLLAHLWDRKRSPGVRFRGNVLPAVALFFIVAGGWFLLAYMAMGEPLIHKMIGKELVGHANWAATKTTPGLSFVKPSLYFLSRFLPWSPLAVLGFWRIWKRPSADDGERRFERFLFCWFFLGLVIFSLAPHQRADLLFPLFPAAALIAGREGARLLRSLAERRVAFGVALLSAVLLVGSYVYYHHVQAKTEVVRETIGVRDTARSFDARFGASTPVLYIDAPFAFQFYRNTMVRRVRLQAAAERLNAGESAFVAVKNADPLLEALAPGISAEELMRWPAKGKTRIVIFRIGKKA